MSLQYKIQAGIVWMCSINIQNMQFEFWNEIIDDGIWQCVDFLIKFTGIYSKSLAVEMSTSIS